MKCIQFKQIKSPSTIYFILSPCIILVIAFITHCYSLTQYSSYYIINDGIPSVPDSNKISLFFIWSFIYYVVPFCFLLMTISSYKIIKTYIEFFNFQYLKRFFFANYLKCFFLLFLIIFSILMFSLFSAQAAMATIKIFQDPFLMPLEYEGFLNNGVFHIIAIIGIFAGCIALLILNYAFYKNIRHEI